MQDAGVQVKPEAEGQFAPESGRVRVRRVLVSGLQADGLVRARGVTVAAHEAGIDRLCDKLAYLDEPLLIVLRDSVLRLAEGALRHQWPAFASVWNIAVRLQPPPDRETTIMTTWLVSRAGPAARSAGYLVELYEWLRRHGVPPTEYALSQLRVEADDNRRLRARLERAVAADRASAGDRAWLEAYQRTESHCEALLAEGEARRAAAAGG